MMSKRYLNKSRFKLAIKCPAKLFYTGKENEYANQTLEDSFLMELAKGGFQVGELAKLYYPGGHDVTTLDHDEALKQTNELLQQDNVTIYEAAVCVGNLFIRVDVLVKKGDRLSLIEVKAKSYKSTESSPFLTRGGTIRSEWKQYLYDVAFQKHVMNLAFPNYHIQAFLMLADKSSMCPTDGLNQKFKLTKNGDGRRTVIVSDNLTEEDLSSPILSSINVDDICNKIFQGMDGSDPSQPPFADRVISFAEHYAADQRISWPISVACSKCEFHTTKEDESNGLKSGLKECWSKQLGWHNSDFNDPTVLDVWNYRSKDKCIKARVFKMTDLDETDIKPKADSKPGISPSERQWLQVQKVKENDSSVWLDCEGLRAEMSKWVYPLHFIDFETSMAAIPFNKGMHPYEGLAFQFSHHVVNENGTVEHRGEYLNAERGEFPSYDFLRSLKSELEGDSGSIFRYATHENTYLNLIYSQLQSEEGVIDDADDLCRFIKTISKSKQNSIDKWIGERNMVDMLEVVKRYFYDPATNGSNSIKAVLPAILNSSDYLKDKYSKPIYGAKNGIKSLNFTDWQWVQFEDGSVLDPYSLLPKMFQDVSERDMHYLLSEDSNELSEGGAAMTAYGKMQFEEMSDYEREEIRQALLKYCELDTMAMVMIYEGWREMLGVE
jgi:hypothetical protein